MTETGFKLERSGDRVRAQVGPVLSNALVQRLGLNAPSNGHSFHSCMRVLAERMAAKATERDATLAGFADHFTYYQRVLSDRRIDPLELWSQLGTGATEADTQMLQSYLPEFLNNLTSELLGWKPVPPLNAFPMKSVYQLLMERTQAQSSPAAQTLVPYAVLGLPSEANLVRLLEHFEPTVGKPGDVCEFGCFRGVTSIKLAFMLKAAGQTDKTVYAFDTFEGFQIDDPGGGQLGKGAFSDNFDSFGELSRWSKVIPVIPVRGDATKTCAIVKRPLSFVWLDLDMGVLMDPVLETIWPSITKDTVVGIDDVGRPETPTVEPWVDEVVRSGRLVETARYPNEFIRFYRRG